MKIIGFRFEWPLPGQQFKIWNPNISTTKQYFCDRSKVSCFSNPIYEKSTQIYALTKNISGQNNLCKSGLLKKILIIYIMVISNLVQKSLEKWGPVRNPLLIFANFGVSSVYGYFPNVIILENNIFESRGRFSIFFRFFHHIFWCVHGNSKSISLFWSHHSLGIFQKHWNFQGKHNRMMFLRAGIDKEVHFLISI